MKKNKPLLKFKKGTRTCPPERQFSRAGFPFEAGCFPQNAEPSVAIDKLTMTRGCTWLPKKSILALSALLFLIHFYVPSYAQQISQGIINYKVNVDSDNPQVKEMLQDAKIIVTFKKGKSRSDMDMGISKNITLTDGDKTTVYIDAMGQKFKMTLDKNKTNPKKVDDDSYDIENTNDTLTVAGYLCKKVVIKTKDGSTFTAYTTDAISASNGSFPYTKVKGFPLQFAMQQHGIKFSCIATSVDITTPVSDDIFKVDDKDYQELTQDQLMQMGGK